jgi:hypothetical protein
LILYVFSLSHIYYKKDQPEFLLSTAIVSVEVLKLVCCVLYIQWVEMKPMKSIVAFLEQGMMNHIWNVILLKIIFTTIIIYIIICIIQKEHKSSKLLAVPAACYIIQMSMECTISIYIYIYITFYFLIYIFFIELTSYIFFA